MNIKQKEIIMQWIVMSILIICMGAYSWINGDNIYILAIIALVLFTAMNAWLYYEEGTRLI